jgi:uncharacterized protein (TIGR04222 family)
MFPFNLPGPAFLAFYACFSAVVLGAFWFYARSGSGASTGSRLGELTSDPYRIGYLRGAEDETVRLAIVNLLDRGLLQSDGPLLQASDGASAEILRRPLDRAILAHCARPAVFGAVAADRAVLAACKAYEKELADAGLVRAQGADGVVFMALLAVLALLGGLGVARVLQALGRGNTNIVFLLILVAAACWVAWQIYSNRRTFAGTSKLRSLQTLMARLKARAATLSGGGETNEALLLAAVFGLSALPTAAFPFVEQLFPSSVPSSSSSGESGISWSSDSGSSCGGGGGSGCGGCGGGGD